ncbi:uncharacterized protein DAT39_012703, partial [Clarias magur]
MNVGSKLDESSTDVIERGSHEEELWRMTSTFMHSCFYTYFEEVLVMYFVHIDPLTQLKDLAHLKDQLADIQQRVENEVQLGIPQ